MEVIVGQEHERLAMGRVGYGVEDLLIADWAAAVLIGAQPRETLDVIEFANLQLLEFRNRQPAR